MKSTLGGNRCRGYGNASSTCISEHHTGGRRRMIRRVRLDEFDEKGFAEPRVVSSVDLHVEEYGSGTPVLVLLHGFGGSARNLRPQARYFRNKHRVVLFDLRGHARSAAPEDPAEYTLSAFVDDLGRVVSKIGEQRVVLGGISLGAAIALHYALTHQQSLEALVLASFPSWGSTAWATGFADAIDARGLESAGAEFIWGSSRFDSEAQRFIRQGFMEHRPHALSAILRRVIAPPGSLDEHVDLRLLSVPTLLLAGAEDEPSVTASKKLATVLPRSELIVVPSAGHLLNLQNPQAFNGAIESFLSEIEH